MNNTIGKNITLTIFGESHGEMIGCVLDGLPGGIKIDEDYLKDKLQKRKSIQALSTPRVEDDNFKIISGVKDGYSEGSPITILIENKNINSNDYESLKDTPRPSHADYVANIKYDGYQDYRGGGHFSGRLTAPMVVAGAILQNILEQKGIYIGSHILSLNDLNDRLFDDVLADIKKCNELDFAVLDEDIKVKMENKIKEVKLEKDSLGGILQTAIYGLEVGIGEPIFDNLESLISHAIFSIPAVKGISFGSGFELAKMKGSQANDALLIKDDKVITKTNHNGGINGGISNGMPIIFQTVIKPTPSIGLSQETINLKEMTNEKLEINGRHDPAIIHRARVVVDSLVALVISDALVFRYGNLWLGK